MAIDLTAETSPDYPGRLINLSNRLSARYRLTGVRADLDAALKVINMAIDLTAETSPNRPRWLNNLSNLLTIRYRLDRVRADFDAALEAISTAIELTDKNSPDYPGMLRPLSNRLTERYRLDGVRADLEMVEWALSELAKWLRRRSSRLSANGLQAHLVSYGQGLPAALARVHRELGFLDGAVDSLELSRGLRFGLVTRRRDRILSDVARTHPELKNQFFEAVAELDQIERLILAGHPVQRALNSAQQVLDESIEQIASSGFGRIGDTPTCEALAGGLLPSQVLVYILPGAAASRHGYLLVVHPDGRVTDVDLPRLAGESLNRMIKASLQLAHNQIDGSRGEQGQSENDVVVPAQRRQNLEYSVADLASWLGTAFADPLLEHLQSCSETIKELILVPVGQLALLPFHASTSANGDLLEVCAIRTFLVGGDLLELASSSRVEPATVDSVVVAPVYDAGGALPGANAEAQAVATFANAKQLGGRKCTHDAFAEALRTATVMHTSCHGHADENVADTCLSLGLNQAAYSVRDAEQLEWVQRDEVFIAACCARTPGMQVPDEVLGFPHAFRAAGFRRVISAGWPVDDNSAALVSMSYHLRRKEHPNMDPAEALRGAQLWLRSASIDTILKFLEEVIAAVNLSKKPIAELVRMYNQFELAAQSADEHNIPYSSAAHWAAFSIIGA